ncbi:MAG: hypothetical protein EB830_01940 [Nitrosopumilus sp. H13]|nr:MAG: hypothetical protein EB830_01940 [Nitrosopumilus sp. H13]
MTRQQPKFLIDPKELKFSKLKPSHKLCIDCTDNNREDPQGVQHFINSRALKNQDAHLGTTYVVSYKRKTIGYVTIATSSINKNEIFQKARPTTRDGPIFPALIILELCIDKKLRKQSFGEYVLMWCNGLARVISEKAGCRYIVLFTKNTINFYSKHNYQLAEITNNNEFKLMYADLFPELKK